MVYVSPIGEIGLIAHSAYSGDVSYNHTALFANKTEQAQYFYTHSTVYTNYQYNKDKTTFIVGDTVANISKFKYMWFDNNPQRNTIFENKRYYAFITDIKYVNNNATEISFTIDLVQTFLFDIDIPPCLIEREHTLSDTIYSQYVAENFNITEKMTVEETDIIPQRFLCGVILDVALDRQRVAHDGKQYIITYSGTFFPKLKNSPAGQLSPGGVVAGVPNSLAWYCGFPLTVDDLIYFKNNPNYTTQHLTASQIDPVTEEPTFLDDEITANYLTASAFISQIVTGELTGYKISSGEATEAVSLSEENIKGVYIYPDFACNNEFIYNAFLLGYQRGVSVFDKNISMPQLFRNPDGTYYSPKNNKIYNYPFCEIECTNNQGQTAIFKPENFSTETPQFRVITNLTNPPMFILSPRYYNGEATDYEKSINITGLPSAYYSGDALNLYLQQNENKRGASLISSAINFGVSLFAAASNGNATTAAAGAGSFASNVIQYFAVEEDLSQTPAQSYALFNSDYLNLAINRCGFTVKYKTIKATDAKIIDDFFTQYGYKIATIKKPNVFEYLSNQSVTLRPCFNYLKTNNCVIKTKDNSVMCDSESLNSLRGIFDRGITFWSTLDNMGDYSLNNEIQE